MRLLATTMLLLLALGVATALAQSPPPAPSGQPAAMSQAQKQAISKSCTDQANAKGLHGKTRKKFRSECKRAAGRPQ
jgi:psiF repeat